MHFRLRSTIWILNMAPTILWRFPTVEYPEIRINAHIILQARVNLIIWLQTDIYYFEKYLYIRTLVYLRMLVYRAREMQKIFRIPVMKSRSKYSQETIRSCKILYICSEDNLSQETHRKWQEIWRYSGWENIKNSHHTADWNTLRILGPIDDWHPRELPHESCSANRLAIPMSANWLDDWRPCELPYESEAA